MRVSSQHRPYEPRAVRGRECELEAVRGLIGVPSFGLLGDVRRMIVEDQLDRCVGRISGIEGAASSSNDYNDSDRV
jgi:hypothetical protein